MKRVMSLAVVAVLMTGCGSVNNALVEKQKTVEYYRIFDIKTKMIPLTMDSADPKAPEGAFFIACNSL